MDVKYIPADWEKMRSSLKELIGKGVYGKGMIDELKEISSNFEKAEDTISKYDSDGVISFTHTNRENTYQGLFEDFDVLYRFTGKVGDIVDRTIDEPFYKDIDDFVVAIRDLSPLNYTTKNRIGATETIHIPQSYQTFEMDKKEVSLDDLFNGDNFYGKQMGLEYEAWKEMNVDADEDITQADYQIAILNTRAFGYESIRDTQENKEFWVNIAALVVIVGATLVFPPAGIALGAAYGVAELSSAVSGKDWVSGRELGTGERWFRGALAPLDIIPGAMAVKKFSGVARTVSFADDLGQLGKTTSLTNKAQSSIQKVNDFALTAGKQATARLKHVDALIMEREAKILAKLADGAIGTARAVDETVVNTVNFITDVMPNLRLAPADGVVQQINPHFLEDLTKGALSKFEGLNIGGGGVPKGTGKGSSGVSEVKIFMETGQQFTNGRRNKLKPDIKYKTGEYDYFYETDNLGRISKFETENLQLTKRKERLSHSRNTPGKVKGQDHAGHLAGDRFGGSPKIDNLVSQLSDVNMKQYKRVEAKWAAALNGKPPKKVTVDVDIVYSGKDTRPEKFKIRYTIDGKFGSAEFKN